MLAALALTAATQLPSRPDTAVTTVPVRSGDTLSLIAAARCGSPGAWSSIYAASRAAGTLGPNPNVIYPGQLAEIACTGGVSPSPAAAPAQAPAAAGGTTWGVSYGHPNYCGDGDGDGWDVDCSTRPSSSAPTTAPAAQPVTLARQAPAATYSGSSSYQSCVIHRESGGDPHAVNASSGAGGLFQFLPSTWASLGYSGLPQNAPVSVQYQAFAKLYAQAGTSPWSPSDGC